MAGFHQPQNAELRAVVGLGFGEFTIDQADYDFEVLSSKSYSLVLAGSKELYSSESILNGTTNLQLVGDSWFARQNITGKSDLLSDLQTDVQFLRISTEATHQFKFNRGASFTPTYFNWDQTRSKRPTITLWFGTSRAHLITLIQ